MACCTESVAFLKHMLKRLNIKKPLGDWGFPELYHIAVLQKQTLTDEKLKMQPRSYWSSYSFLQRYILSCIYRTSDGKLGFIFSEETPQNRLENNGDITLVGLRVYGKPSHNSLCSLLPFWQVETVVLSRILTLCIRQRKDHKKMLPMVMIMTIVVGKTIMKVLIIWMSRRTCGGKLVINCHSREYSHFNYGNERILLSLAVAFCH